MILEGIATTLDPDGRVNIAPMGPRVTLDMRHLTFRPYNTSQTYKNLKAHGQGVFHVVDDVELLAQAAVGTVEAELRPAVAIKGYMLSAACRAYEFKVTSIDDREERTTIEAEVLRSESLRELFGFNRAKHAVVEAAILATRIEFLPMAQIQDKLTELSILVLKTGGPSEQRAFELVERYVETAARLLAQKSAPENGVSRVRVVAGSRLHFGLLAAAGGRERQFGGAGLMVAGPRIELEAERSERPEALGPLSERALEFARKFSREPSPPYRLRVVNAPRDHIGLGTGTQLAMAVARAITALRKESIALPDLAQCVGRGRRSGIGVHGFEQGGFIVDAGKKNGEGLAPLALRIAVPESWRFLLALPRKEAGISGRTEEDAFRRLDAAPEEAREEATERLCRTLLLGIVPAILEADLSAFGRALHEYGARAGEVFKSVQGGSFASEKTAKIIEFLIEEGIAGTGQSSWGPTVYAAVEGDDPANHLKKRLEERFGSELEVVVTRPMNTGAKLEKVGDRTEKEQ